MKTSGNLLITPRQKYRNHMVVEIPRSKSMLNRYLMMHALQFKAIPAVDFSGEADDVRLMQHVISQLLQATHSPDVTVELHCGNAGTVARMGAVLAGFLGVKTVITGDKRLLERPLGELSDLLEQAGVRTRFFDKPGFPPIQIAGNGYKTRHWEVRASQSSQHLSALLLTGPFVKKGITVNLQDKLVSESYVDLTIRMMIDAGARVERSGRVIRVEEGGYPLLQMPVEADWSAAAFAFQATALMPERTEVLIRNLNRSGFQGDEAAEHLFSLLGVAVREHPNGLVAINLGSTAEIISADLIETPDLFNAFAITTALSHVNARIKYPPHLAFKESDRLDELVKALKNNGFEATVSPEMLALSPRLEPYPNTLLFDSAGDHRIAMSCALAGIKSPTILSNPFVVSKSFPDFFNQMNQFVDTKEM
jgi:3-phosphoshikimate 1-carboxyvinyltransferase